MLAPIVLECVEPPRTLRQLLHLVVNQQVEAFLQRRQYARLLQVLTAKEIAEGCEVGRIVPGGQDQDRRAPTSNQAIDAAITAFQDGCYFVFINDLQVEELEACIGEVREVLFVRLTPLVGG